MAWQGCQCEQIRALTPTPPGRYTRFMTTPKFNPAKLKLQIRSLVYQLRLQRKMERTERVIKTKWGATIYNLRRTRMMTCSELAVKAGISKGAITMMETGKRPNPSLDGIIRIAAAFGMSASELLKRYEKTSTPNEKPPCTQELNTR